MKVLALPGGATKALQIVIATIAVYNAGFRPDVILVNSASAITGLPLELGLYKESLIESRYLELEDMFKVKPTNGKGKITFRGHMRALGGFLGMKNKYSFGLQDTRHFTKRYINKTTFDLYKKGEYADIIIFTTNPTTKYFNWHNARDLEFDQYVEAVEASAHIPAMTEAVKVKGEYEVDGGNWGHNPEWIALQYWKEILGEKPTKVVSIYPREAKFKAIESDDWKKNVGNNLANVLRTYTIANSMCGQFCAENFCKANGIDHLQLFCPQVTQTQYDVDDADLERAEKETEDYIKKQFGNFQFS